MEGQYCIGRNSGAGLHIINIVTLAVHKGSSYRFYADVSKILRRRGRRAKAIMRPLRLWLHDPADLFRLISWHSPLILQIPLNSTPLRLLLPLSTQPLPHRLRNILHSPPPLPHLRSLLP